MNAIADLEIAPFHLLASERAVHVDRDHVWHMDTLARLCAADPDLLRATPYQLVTLTDDDSERAAIAWWLALTAAGGEGMVVKALHRFVENEPLYRVHECVFGVLALESEPVDPRL